MIMIIRAVKRKVKSKSMERGVITRQALPNQRKAVQQYNTEDLKAKYDLHLDK